MKASPMNGLMKLLCMADLLDPFSKLQAELRYVSQCQLPDDKLSISDDDCIYSLMKELKIDNKENLLGW